MNKTEITKIDKTLDRFSVVAFLLIVFPLIDYINLVRANDITEQGRVFLPILFLSLLGFIVLAQSVKFVARRTRKAVRG